MNADRPAEGSPFHDLADYVAIPRVGALRLAPDGSWQWHPAGQTVFAFLAEHVLGQEWERPVLL